MKRTVLHCASAVIDENVEVFPSTSRENRHQAHDIDMNTLEILRRACPADLVREGNHFRRNARSTRVQIRDPSWKVRDADTGYVSPRRVDSCLKETVTEASPPCHERRVRTITSLT